MNGALNIVAWVLSGVCAWGHTHSVLDTLTVVTVVYALTPWTPGAR